MNPRSWLTLAAVLIVGFGVAIGTGWIRDSTEPTTKLPSPRVGQDFAEYRSERLWSVALVDGVKEDGPHEVFIKRYAREGKLALCGYLLRRDFNSERALRWLEQAKLEIAGHRFSAGFIAGQKPGFSPGDAQAGCIATEISFDPALLAAKIEFTGVPVIESRK